MPMQSFKDDMVSLCGYFDQSYYSIIKIRSVRDGKAIYQRKGDEDECKQGLTDVTPFFSKLLEVQRNEKQI